MFIKGFIFQNYNYVNYKTMFKFDYLKILCNRHFGVLFLTNHMVRGV